MAHKNDNESTVGRGGDNPGGVGVESTHKFVTADVQASHSDDPRYNRGIVVRFHGSRVSSVVEVPAWLVERFARHIEAFDDSSAPLDKALDRRPSEAPPKNTTRPWYPIELIETSGVLQSEGSNVHITLIHDDCWTLCRMSISRLQPLDDAMYKMAILQGTNCRRCHDILMYKLAVEAGGH